MRPNHRARGFDNHSGGAVRDYNIDIVTSDREMTVNSSVHSRQIEGKLVLKEIAEGGSATSTVCLVKALL